MKKIILIPLLLLIIHSFAQSRKTENIILITLDGMRWQEVFTGADSAIIANKKYTPDSADVVEMFWNKDVKERRKKVFPFFWSVIEKNGSLYGNRNLGNFVNNANPYWFSYPGYNEILTGYPDTAVNSNDKIYNKNENVLEFINKQKGYNGKVAAFATWDVIPYIINDKRNGIYVNADSDSLQFNNSALKLINEWQFLSPRPLGVRPDVITYFMAREYLKAYKPKVLYISFDETDDFAHGGMYEQYLRTANREDAMIADLWNTIQSMPEYKNKTTMIITTDHGRGDKIKDQWRDHGTKVLDASGIWFAVIGPDTTPLGEVKTSGQLYQKQYAATIAALLGLKFNPQHTIGEVIAPVLK
ncbi:MAG: alkaline phosphatase family protein [Chitinophagaceae bacterium]|nr:alkaline phosphatase family protein [Chitinophagaceae bacterium]